MKHYFNQTGRSMIEMLGVLAIVGVLSVGGIAAYSKALLKYKLNKLTEEYALFIQNILANEDVLRRTNIVFLANILSAMRISPDNWKLQGNSLYDSSNRNVIPHIRPETRAITIDYYIKKSATSRHPSKEDELLCRTLWIDVVQAFYDVIQRSFIYTEGKAHTTIYWGSRYCTPNRSCISDLTISEITSLCHSCVEDAHCMLAIDFK